MFLVTSNEVASLPAPRNAQSTLSRRLSPGDSKRPPAGESRHPLHHPRVHFVVPAPISSCPRRRESRGGMGGAIGPSCQRPRNATNQRSKVQPPLPRWERIEVRVKRLPRHQPPSRKQRQPIVEREKCSAEACPQPGSHGHPAGESRHPLHHPRPHTSSCPRRRESTQSIDGANDPRTNPPTSAGR